MSEDWFVCPRTNPEAQTRIFFFPYAGGGPTIFHRWCAGLPDHLEGWSAHYPGRGSRHREPALTEMDSLVGALSAAILPLLDRPFAFFGHSMGSIVAFELARQLRRLGLPAPLALFASGRAAPHLPGRPRALHRLPDQEFIAALQAFNGLPAGLLQTPDALGLFLPVLRADLELIETYRYRPGDPPLPCPIFAFGGLEDPHVSADELESWAEHTDAGLRTQYFSGDHFFLNTAREAMLTRIAAETVKSSHAR